MKRLFLFILSLWYLSTSAGATVNLHYCMDKLVDSSFLANDSKACPKCGMHKDKESNKGCCKDEQKQVKVQDDHKASSIQHYELKWIDVLSDNLPGYQMAEVYIFSAVLQYPVSNAPPQAGAKTYILNCLFRI